MRTDRQTDLAFEESDDRAVLCGPGLCLEFARQGDRWTHSLHLPLRDAIEVARVVESDPQRDDPTRIVSPVYQEVQHHRLAERPGLCLLLTGRLFQHHFSAAVS